MDAFFELIQIGIGKKNSLVRKILPDEWEFIFELALRHGVCGIVFDGIKFSHEQGSILNINFNLKMDWIGLTHEIETLNRQHEATMKKLGRKLSEYGYKMMILKGYGLSQNYPIPDHRTSGDLDIWCFGLEKEVDKIIEAQGLDVDNSHHHHSVFRFEEESVENHFDFINIYTRPSAKRVERKLKELAYKGYSEKDGLYYPSADFNAIFLLRHCASHFAPTEMTVKQVMDWGFFMEKHHQEINWSEYVPFIKKEGMSRFYNLLGLFCVRELGFEESIFHGLYYDDLYERFKAEVVTPEFQKRESGSLIRAMWIKPTRWWHNRWKSHLCYPDSLVSTFIYNIWGKLLKPTHFVQ